MVRVHALATAEQPSARSCGAGEPLNDKNFRHLCDYVQRSCGIKLTPKKKSMIDGRLRRRMRALGIDNINEYCRLLLDGNADETELVSFIDAITTNKTDFFREPAHFVFLQRRALPAYQKEGRRSIKVWSAASSTGAEAYTIAMVIDDFFRMQGGTDFKILATDISTEVLAKGKDALYADTMMEPIPEEYRRRYILIPKDPARREFRIAGKLRSKVSFHQLNLMDDRYPFDRDFDMIFLRNVLIYFDRPTQEAVLTKLCEHLRPGGYLFLGHSESLAGAGLPVITVANTIFRRG
jgi:chemotaxis protein methyltransferase CheR